MTLRRKPLMGDSIVEIRTDASIRPSQTVTRTRSLRTINTSVSLSDSAFPLALTACATVVADNVPCSAAFAVAFASPRISSSSESMAHMMSTRTSPNAVTLGLFSEPADEDGRWSTTERTKAMTSFTERDLLGDQERRVADSNAWYAVVSATLLSGSCGLEW